MIFLTARITGCKSYLMQQTRQNLANVPLAIQSQELNYPKMDEMMSNDPKEVIRSFWYSNVGTG
jgi:hypothetical protein